MNRLSRILAAVEGACALCMIGAVKLFAPVCDKMLTLTTGKEVHMKCFYAGEAAIAISVILMATALMTFFAKKEHKKLMVVCGVCAIMLFLIFTSLIGVCANPEMPCNVTALWGKLIAGAGLIAALAALIGGKEGQLPG